MLTYTQIITWNNTLLLTTSDIYRKDIVFSLQIIDKDYELWKEKCVFVPPFISSCIHPCGGLWICSEVFGWGPSYGAWRLQAGQGKCTCHHLHWWDWCYSHQAFWCTDWRYASGCLTDSPVALHTFYLFLCFTIKICPDYENSFT